MMCEFFEVDLPKSNLNALKHLFISYIPLVGLFCVDYHAWVVVVVVKIYSSGIFHDIISLIASSSIKCKFSRREFPFLM